MNKEKKVAGALLGIWIGAVILSIVMFVIWMPVLTQLSKADNTTSAEAITKSTLKSTFWAIIVLLAAAALSITSFVLQIVLCVITHSTIVRILMIIGFFFPLLSFIAACISLASSSTSNSK
ncbi:hypothetical protein [Mycoplasmopsis adleri]|uniref:hypothetical protein n=1 Tax=Mycoplasmopsis adleri TaxID=51362 RepID=UPI003873B5F7